MSEEELRDQINRIAIKINEVEEVAKKKENYIKSKLTEEYDVKINGIKLNLQTQEKLLNELQTKIDDLESKKKIIIPIINNLKKEYRSLIKEKEKVTNTKLKEIVNEKKTKMKNINREIKILEKELNRPKTD
jgi:hypothetical protein